MTNEAAEGWLDERVERIQPGQEYYVSVSVMQEIFASDEKAEEWLAVRGMKLDARVKNGLRTIYRPGLTHTPAA